VNIKESRILREFAGDKISFLSYFTPGTIPYREKYFIGYNPKKLEDNQLTFDEMRSVLAHELAHTVQWENMKSDFNRIRNSLFMEISFKSKRLFESNADRIAISLGLSVSEKYTEGLISYRETNYVNTEDREEQEYLLKLYNFADELRQIESEESSSSSIVFRN
jgi:hypothetical protein